eukprot:4293936-Pyramimonas_sp.AAC.1
MDRSAMERGGRPRAQDIGSDDYRIHQSQQILKISKSVVNAAVESFQAGHELLKEHQRSLSMSIARGEAERRGAPA